MRAFEIHTYQNGRWIIDSIFDDRELALIEARRMDDTKRYPGIRVVEEVYDAGTRETQRRTLFRGSKVAEANLQALETARETRQSAQEAARRRQLAQVERRRAAQHLAKRRETDPIRLIAILTGLGIAAIAALVALQEIRSLL